MIYIGNPGIFERMLKKNGPLTVTMLSFLMVVPLSLLFIACSEGASDWNDGSIRILPGEGEKLTTNGYPIRTAIPGDTLVFTLWIENNATTEQNVSLSMVKPEDWQIALDGHVVVPSKGSMNFSLIATVPLEFPIDPDGDFPVRVEALGNSNGDKAFIIVIIDVECTVDHDLLLAPYNTKVETVDVYPGQRTYMDIVLKNRGEMVDSYDITFDETYLDWDIQFREGTDIVETTLQPGGSGSSYYTRVEVGVPITATPGGSATIGIRSYSEVAAQYGSGKTTDSISVIFKVVKGSTLTIKPIDPSMKDLPIGPVEVQFTVVHTGIMGSNYYPAMSIFSGNFRQDGWDLILDLLGQTYFEVGEERTVSASITPPPGTSGTFELIVAGTSDNAIVNSAEMELTFRSPLNITLSEPSGGPFHLGEKIEISFKVNNLGDDTKQLLLEVRDLPSCYYLEMLPSSSLTIGPQRGREVFLVLHQKDEVAVLDFTITIEARAASDEDGEAWTVAARLSIPIEVIELPNLGVTSVVVPNMPIEEGGKVVINITVENLGDIPVEGFTVKLFEVTFQFSRVEIDAVLMSLDAKERSNLTFNWTARPSARSIRAVIIPPEGTDESTTDDNELSEPIYVRRIYDGIEPDGGTGDGSSVPAGIAVAAVAGACVLVGAVAFAVSTDAFRYAFFTAAFPLYSKLRPESILSNRLRKRIYVYVQNNPGDHFRSILVNLNLTNGTLAHHLYTLEKENLIRSQRDGLYRRFYPAGFRIEEDRVNLSQIQQSIIDEVKTCPGLSQKELSQRLGLSSSTVNYNIKSLKDRGLVSMRKDGKSTRVHPVTDEHK